MARASGRVHSLRVSAGALCRSFFIPKRLDALVFESLLAIIYIANSAHYRDVSHYCRAVRTLAGNTDGALQRKGLMSSPPRRV